MDAIEGLSRNNKTNLKGLVLLTFAFRCMQFVFFFVGVQGFEPWTPWSQTRCATGLRYTPKSGGKYFPQPRCKSTQKINISKQFKHFFK